MPDDQVDAALYSLAAFVGEAVGFLGSAGKGIKIVNDLHNMGRRFGINQHPENNTTAHQEFLHALTLLATWGAFEASFDDYCFAILRRDARASHRRKTLDRLFEKTKDVQSVIKFEARLTGIDRHGEVPPDLLATLKEASAVRNVWAHAAGVADDWLVRKFPDLGCVSGEKVRIEKSNVIRYVFALGAYGMILVSRDRIKNDKPVLPSELMDKNPFKQEYTELFG